MSDAPISAQLFDRAQQVIPGGVNSPVRAMTAVGLDGDRTVAAAGTDEREPDRQVDDRRSGRDREADADVFERDRVEEAPDGDHDTQPRADARSTKELPD